MYCVVFLLLVVGFLQWPTVVDAIEDTWKESTVASNLVHSRFSLIGCKREERRAYVKCGRHRSTFFDFQNES